MPTRRFDTNNYEFNKNSSVGVYLIHGFSNTTYEIKELAEFLANNGFHTALKDNQYFLNGLNIFKGKITYKAVAECLGYDFVSPEVAIN